MKNKILQKTLKSYQWFSKLTPPSCRYYPTCSEYAKWHLDNSPLAVTLASSAYRVMRCNQLFDGGIDYPVSCYKPPSICMLQNEFFIASVAYISSDVCRIKPSNDKMKIIYWRVPVKDKYAIIKDFNDHNTQKST